MNSAMNVLRDQESTSRLMAYNARVDCLLDLYKDMTGQDLRGHTESGDINPTFANILDIAHIEDDDTLGVICSLIQDFAAE